MRGKKLVPKILKIFDISKEGAHVYQQSETNRVSFMTPLIANSIQTLKLTASAHGLVSLSANCLKQPLYSVFAIHENPKQNIWKSQQYKIGNYYQYINPEILEYSKDIIENVEQCPAFPFMKATIKRSRSIKVKYKNINKQEKEDEFSGFKSILFQHQIDHLDGISFIQWQRNLGKVQLKQQVMNELPKVHSLLCDYRQKMAKTLKDYPQLAQSSIDHPENISFYKDFIRRLVRHYGKQYTLYEARQALK